jgi:UDP-N-acetyl-2-amino-2-deoxyglucuronate dehydrogenase
MDSYFPDTGFFVEFERFDRHIDLMRRKGSKIDIVTICSPNYLHDAHCRFALRSDTDAICEKPLVLNPWNLDGLTEIERETNRKISTILQLRLHPAIQALKKRIEGSACNDEIDVELTYITSRGRWYHTSWKGDDSKSGGIATNIGVHFFDMLFHVFGPMQRSFVHVRERERAAGYLEAGRARVRWFLSVDRNDLPPDVTAANKMTYRSMRVDGEEVEFSDGFTDLHVRSYEEILAGRGFGIADVRPSVEIVSAFRTAPVELRVGQLHPMAYQRVHP